MIDFIQSTDASIIQFIDKNCSGGFFDSFFQIFTIAGHYGIIWILLLSLFSLKEKKRHLWLVWGASFAAAGFLFEFCMKNIVHRNRPFIDMPDLLISTFKPASFSFPSSHASLSGAALAFFLIFSDKLSIKAAVLLIAVLTSLSRVWLKVHYPSDVIAGFVFGMITTYAIARIFRKKNIKHGNTSV